VGAAAVLTGMTMMDDDELEQPMQTALDGVRAAVMRPLQEDEVPPQLVVLAVARVTGELGADIAHAGGVEVETVLSDLADLVRHAGREQYEKQETGAMPVAGSA
jgi:hypothetical protein